MSDIDSNMLERLHQQSEEIMRLRAEIERLWGEIGHLKILLQNLLTRPTDEVVIRQARAALEGEAMTQGNMDTLSWVIRDPHEAADEIARLQVEIAQGNAAWKEAHIGCEIEIERLKAALQEIADHKSASLGILNIARAALEGDEALFPTKICPECGQPMREGGYCDHIPF